MAPSNDRSEYSSAKVLSSQTEVMFCLTVNFFTGMLDLAISDLNLTSRSVVMLTKSCKAGSMSMVHLT